MNGISKIGLDGGSRMRVSSGSEKVKRTPLVEPAESGRIVVSRSKGFGSAYERRRHSRRVSMLLVCAAAIIIASAFAVASLGRESQSTVPGHTSAPLPPFFLYGYVYDSVGALMPNLVVTVTDQTTGDSAMTITDDGTFGMYGGYTFDLSSFTNGYTEGDTIGVNATGPGGTVGSNSTVLALNPPYYEMNITLSASGIPEFTTIVIPVIGMGSILVVARVASSRREEA